MQLVSVTSHNSYTENWHGRLQTDNDRRHILLIGTAGRGKSSTGNSILGRPGAFKVSDDSRYTSREGLLSMSAERSHIKLTVYDSLTIPDKRMTKSEVQRMARESLQKCFADSSKGFHVLLFVLDFNSRITEEEQIAVDTFKHLLGADWVNHCMLIFTHGENFELQRKKRGGKSFQEWYQDIQDPLARKLVADFGNNVMLFHNEDEAMMHDTIRNFDDILKKNTARITDIEPVSGI